MKKTKKTRYPKVRGDYPTRYISKGERERLAEYEKEQKSQIRWEKRWAKVELACKKAKLVAFDDCHKIYLAMDESEANNFIKHPGYTTLIGTPEQMSKKVKEWFYASCPLRFVSKVKAGKFNNVIKQFAQ